MATKAIKPPVRKKKKAARIIDDDELSLVGEDHYTAQQRTNSKEKKQTLLQEQHDRLLRDANTSIEQIKKSKKRSDATASPRKDSGVSLQSSASFSIENQSNVSKSLNDEIDSIPATVHSSTSSAFTYTSTSTLTASTAISTFTVPQNGLGSATVTNSTTVQPVMASKEDIIITPISTPRNTRDPIVSTIRQESLSNRHSVNSSPQHTDRTINSHAPSKQQISRSSSPTSAVTSIKPTARTPLNVQNQNIADLIASRPISPIRNHIDIIEDVVVDETKLINVTTTTEADADATFKHSRSFHTTSSLDKDYVERSLHQHLAQVNVNHDGQEMENLRSTNSTDSDLDIINQSKEYKSASSIFRGDEVVNDHEEDFTNRPSVSTSTLRKPSAVDRDFENIGEAMRDEDEDETPMDDGSLASRREHSENPSGSNYRSSGSIGSLPPDELEKLATMSLSSTQSLAPLSPLSMYIGNNSSQTPSLTSAPLSPDSNSPRMHMHTSVPSTPPRGPTLNGINLPQGLRSPIPRDAQSNFHSMYVDRAGRDSDVDSLASTSPGTSPQVSEHEDEDMGSRGYWVNDRPLVQEVNDVTGVEELEQMDKNMVIDKPWNRISLSGNQSNGINGVPAFNSGKPVRTHRAQRFQRTHQSQNSISSDSFLLPKAIQIPETPPPRQSPPEGNARHVSPLVVAGDYESTRIFASVDRLPVTTPTRFVPSQSYNYSLKPINTVSSTAIYSRLITPDSFLSPPLPADVHLHGSHIKLILHPIRREKRNKLLPKQNWQCPSCKVKLTNRMFSRPRYCTYTGLYYCRTCNIKETAVIPGRVLWYGDCREYKVNRMAYQYLLTIFTLPVLPMAAISPFLYQASKRLRFAFLLRQQLVQLRPFVYSCPQRNALLSLLGSRTYMLNDTAIVNMSLAGQATTFVDIVQASENYVAPPSSMSPSTPHQPFDAYASDSIVNNDDESSNGFPNQDSLLSSTSFVSPHLSASLSAAASLPSHSASASSSYAHFEPSLRDMYSLRDLVEILEGALCARLSKLVRRLILHVCDEGCESCRSQAVMCSGGSCQNREHLFPFQINKVIQCSQCGYWFHRTCYHAEQCDQCARIQAAEDAQRISMHTAV